MDYRRIAVDELRHINELRAAERICRDRLIELNDQLRSLKIPAPQTDPVQGGGNKVEDRWLNLIALKSDEEKRLRNVRRRLKRFDTAWAVLTERDRSVLEIWYIDKGRYDRAERVIQETGCVRSTAFEWRDTALLNFTRAFYGEVVT